MRSHHHPWCPRRGEERRGEGKARRPNYNGLKELKQGVKQVGSKQPVIRVNPDLETAGDSEMRDKQDNITKGEAGGEMGGGEHGPHIHMTTAPPLPHPDP